MVSLLKEIAHHIDPNKPVYDVLLEDYERGFTTSQIDKIFQELKDGLQPLLKKIVAKGWQPDGSFLKNKKFDLEQQKKFCFQIAEDCGFELVRRMKEI